MPWPWPAAMPQFVRRCSQLASETQLTASPPKLKPTNGERNVSACAVRAPRARTKTDRAIVRANGAEFCLMMGGSAVVKQPPFQQARADVQECELQRRASRAGDRLPV